MKRFKKILCVVDARAKRQDALARAVTLADRNGAHLKVIDVVDDSPSWIGLLQSHRQELVRDHASCLRRLVASLPDQHLSATTELLHGRTAIEATKEVLRGGFEMVIKDARGNSAHKTLTLGSVDMRLLRNCPCPVWIHAVAGEADCTTILAAVDPFARTREEERLNRAILEFAASLSAMQSKPLHVVGAWEPPGEGLLAGRVSRDRLLEYVAETHRAAKHGLARFTRRCDQRLKEDQIHLRKGDPADVLVTCVEDLHCDLLVMGAVAHGGPGFLMGNTADTVLRQIECSVLTIKPESFVSPVKVDHNS